MYTFTKTTILKLIDYKGLFEDYLYEHVKLKNTLSLYDPIRYILNIGGKRLRPIMAMMSSNLFCDSYKIALDASVAIELFHNFTLMHDDIMDNAPFRRKKQTVHEKWNLNRAILSGDAMLILSHRFLEPYNPDIFKNLMKLFLTF